MAGKRKFSKAFKSQVVEEFLAGEVTQAQLARRYGISDHLILQWRRRYAEGKLEEVVLARRYGLSDHLIVQWRKRYAEGKLEETASPSDKDERIKELERMVGRLTMENELLKKGVRFALLRENERSSTISGPISNRSSGGVE
jgi:transposase